MSQPHASNKRPYQWLAEYYDEVFGKSRAPADLARERILGKILPSITSACDLACGTGATALKLAKVGIRVYAVDLSPAMCRITGKKVARVRPKVRVLQADMRSFRLPEQVDLVTCELDAINHLSRKSDLKSVAKSVHRALRPGGYFFFDVNNSLGFRRYWIGTVCIEKPGLVLVMRNGHNTACDRAWSDLDWFIRTGNCWDRRSERVQEVCWTKEEIGRVFREAGFVKLRGWDAARFFKANPIITPGCRTVYLAQKTAGEA